MFIWSCVSVRVHRRVLAFKTGATLKPVASKDDSLISLHMKQTFCATIVIRLYPSHELCKESRIFCHFIHDSGTASPPRRPGFDCRVYTKHFHYYFYQVHCFRRHFKPLVLRLSGKVWTVLTSLWHQSPSSIHFNPYSPACRAEFTRKA